MKINCPHCGKSHYSEGYSQRTAVYYPPIWKDGVNINPDRNTTTTYAHCYECDYDFVIKEECGTVWVEEGEYNPPKPPIDANITSFPDVEYAAQYIPSNSFSTAVATIDKEGNPLREKTKVEIDIKDIKEQLAKLTQMVESLWEHNTHGNLD